MLYYSSLCANCLEIAKGAFDPDILKLIEATACNKTLLWTHQWD